MTLIKEHRENNVYIRQATLLDEQFRNGLLDTETYERELMILSDKSWYLFRYKGSRAGLAITRKDLLEVADYAEVYYWATRPPLSMRNSMLLERKELLI
tara:strand:+ start:981 stop:1277 length:297 start_codon:yes stop_codon:yes gene_type:complete